MAVRVIREVNRFEGYPKFASAPDIIAGQPLLLAAGKTVKAYDDGTWAAIPYGIASDSTAKLPIAPSSGDPLGVGYDYTNFARGGLVGAFVDGSELELSDDGRGAPYETADTYALNGPVYAKENGNVTSVGTGPRQLIGVVTDFDVAVSPTRLRIKFFL